MGKRIWSEEIIISEIQKRKKKGLSLRPSAIRKDYRTLYYAGDRYFGSWRDALSAAGLEYEGQSYRRWNKKKIIRAIRKRKRDGLSISTYAIQKEDPSLYVRAVKIFGSWKNVMKAAGLKYDKPVPQKWSKEKVVNEIKKLKKKGKKINHNFIFTHHRSLYSAAYRYFRSWRNILKAAGLDPDNPNK